MCMHDMVLYAHDMYYATFLPSCKVLIQIAPNRIKSPERTPRAGPARAMSSALGKSGAVSGRQPRVDSGPSPVHPRSSYRTPD